MKLRRSSIFICSCICLCLITCITFLYVCNASIIILPMGRRQANFRHEDVSLILWFGLRHHYQCTLRGAARCIFGSLSSFLQFKFSLAVSSCLRAPVIAGIAPCCRYISGAPNPSRDCPSLGLVRYDTISCDQTVSRKVGNGWRQ
jgi:hypothetical protein